MENLNSVIVTSFAQAVVSSLVSLLLGGISAFGLVKVRSSLRHPVELFLLLPQVLPSLFILIATYNVFGLFGEIPTGFLSVVLVHSLINCGLCSVLLARVLTDKIGSYSELARVEGASLTVFLPALFSLIYRDLIFVFFTVFVFCFTSFSIPFVIGGYGSETIEVLIYQKIIAEGDLGQALVLAAFQFVFIMVTGIYLYGRGFNLSEKRYRPFRYGHFLALSPLLLINTVIVLSSLRGVTSGVQNFFEQDMVRAISIHAAYGTLTVSVVAGLTMLGLLSLLVFIWPSRRTAGVLFSFAPPSPILFGFLLFLLGVHQIYGNHGFLFLGVVLAFFFCAFVFRFGLASTLSRYERQVEVARTLGASRELIFSKVTWPQVTRSLFFFSGVGAFWAAGDFALSLFILPGEAHLPLLIRGLISRYRLDLATLFMWGMVLIGFVQLMIFQGLGYVFSRKSI